VTGSNGRADIRLLTDDEGELYILSKSDGMIRAIVGPEANADFDADGDVDGSDFLVWQRHVHAGSRPQQGDADGDKAITAADLQYWTEQYGGNEPPSAAVPEPAGGALAGLALAFLALRCKPGRPRVEAPG
jgi:hypothetical protein